MLLDKKTRRQVSFKILTTSYRKAFDAVYPHDGDRSTFNRARTHYLVTPPGEHTEGMKPDILYVESALFKGDYAALQKEKL